MKGTCIMQKGLEINFFDLFRYLAKRLVVLLTFALIIGFAANCYGYHRIKTAEEKEQQALAVYAEQLGVPKDNLPEYFTAELADLRKALTDEEASYAEAIAKLYMYRMWASDKVNQELIIGEPDGKDLEIVQTLYYCNEAVQSAVEVMTSAEKSYYNVLVKQLSGTDMSATEKNISSTGLIQPKWIVIGVVLGFFLGTLLVSMAYSLSRKLRTAHDMETPFGVPVLATVKPQSTDSTINAVAKGIHRIFDSDGQQMLLISSVDTQKARDICELLLKSFPEEKVSISWVTNEPCSFIADISDAGAVLFVEQIGKSKYTDIKERISCCSKFSVPTVGCIVIE